MAFTFMKSELKVERKLRENLQEIGGKIFRVLVVRRKEIYLKVRKLQC
jgi:hypothetical protein